MNKIRTAMTGCHVNETGLVEGFTSFLILELYARKDQDMVSLLSTSSTDI